MPPAPTAPTGLESDGAGIARAVRCCPVFAAFVAAIGLLMIAFAAVAAFRVAQESRFASLQSDLARRGQAAPPQTGQRVAVIETPGPHIAPPPPLPVVSGFGSTLGKQ